MNYFKAAEELLSSVPEMEWGLKNLIQREKRLLDQGKPREPGSMNFDKPFTSVKYVVDTLGEVLAVSQVAKNIENTRTDIAEIKNVLGQLSSEQQKILTLWYIEKRSKEAIMEILHISSIASLYNLRNRAVAVFALHYYGSSALPSI